MAGTDKGVTVTITPAGRVHGITVDGADVGRHVRTSAATLVLTGDYLPALQLTMEADRIIVAEQPEPNGHPK